ncbi:DUF983 domain-containing protein [Sphingosinicellaceae bacterium]|nr:DUF983 domain-containing protein [Sphingosinicellaceae bacterium]
MTRKLARPLVTGALLGACPQCGAPTLFRSVAGFAKRCPKCGLDFEQFDVGDAAAPFLIFLVGTVVVVGAIWLELSRSPPWWVHALIWVPLTIILTLALLRFAKAMLVALEYKNEAKLGRLE